MDREEGKKPEKSFISRPVGILRKQLGYTWEFPEPHLARAIIPTLPHEGFDCSSKKMTPWSLMKLFDSLDMSDFWPLHQKSDGKEEVSYILNCKLEVDRSFYSVDSPKYPLYIERRILFVKRSSRCVENLLRHPERERPYVRFSAININMDPDTRKPIPYPEWWKEQFNFPSEGKRTEYTLPPKPNKGVCRSQHRVNFSDTDANIHTNYTVYVRFCYDSFCENVLNKKYGAKLDPYEVGVKTMKITYLKEVNLGDILTVESWEDSNVKDTYHFEMRNNTELSATISMNVYNLLPDRYDSRL